MSKQTEAIKLAIEVFGGGDWHDEIVDTDWADKANNSITVLREALAEQPAQQEPVKWADHEPDGMRHNKPSQISKPTKWLAREEEQEIKNNCTTVSCVLKAVKAKLYTTQQAQQEPVAEIRGDMKGGGYVHWLSEDYFASGTKLYTSPPAQQEKNT